MSSSLVDTICEIGVPSIEIALAGAAKGLTDFNAQSVGSYWSWNRAKLNELSTETLASLLDGLKEMTTLQ